jgi:hypothetical protein
MKYLIGFCLGLAASYALMDKGINLPQRLSDAVDKPALQRLWTDVRRSFR